MGQQLSKVNLANCLESLDALYDYLNSWSEIKNSFRIDGVENISPANPSQWIFFKIENFEKVSFDGVEKSGVSCDGTSWNGTYYLSGGTRSKSLLEFLNLYEKYDGNPNKIFNLAYTSGKEGFPNKRRIELNDYKEPGWNCLKYRANNY
ncbi:hypothetical protein [Bacteriovorax sp. BSW11_IV]|uniref:hypothetical protein n=1 Tax=Bacteriovorax sp. BSW11_IV TaxID=1353529 RepID=UPI00041C179B|nr:hypothetical protein [Bacteriovorax sp. BSW11_IV]